MERLTNSDKEIPTLVDNAEYWLQAYFKLKDYENAEEQGLLLKLPCKVGAIVYLIINQRDNYDDTIYQVVSATIFELSMIDNIGKTVFLTQDEAEQKLKAGGENENIH